MQSVYIQCNNTNTWLPSAYPHTHMPNHTAMTFSPTFIRPFEWVAYAQYEQCEMYNAHELYSSRYPMVRIYFPLLSHSFYNHQRLAHARVCPSPHECNHSFSIGHTMEFNSILRINLTIKQ